MAWVSGSQKGLPFFLWLILYVAALIPSIRAGVVEGGWIPSLLGCRGTAAECLAENEFDLGFEASRRVLATSNYISYNALRRDSVPCSCRGASYYNCRPGAQANPYSRSCSAITRCRR